MSPDSYPTLGRAASEEIVINKSRFIGYASPCASAEEAQQYLQGVRQAHPTASHHCFAYVIGSNAGIMRYSDDGEPSGTAGLPIMSVLKAKSIRDACVVVVRYFGGVLLGAGGLARAYSRSSALAVEAAGVVWMSPSVRLSVELPYPLWDRTQRLMDSLPIRVEETAFTDVVKATILCRLRDMEHVCGGLMQQSEGRAGIEELRRFYMGWPAETDST